MAPKPNIIYPIVQLPQLHGDVIGSHFIIFETIYEERKAFPLVLDNGIKQPSVLRNSEHANLIDCEKRINGLGKKIRTIENVLSTTREIETARLLITAVLRDGLEEIRTPDLRHVKATS